MHNDKMIEYVKRWQDIQKRKADLDYETSVLARDIRSEFKPGEVGDQQFIGWCGLELGMLPQQATELLERAEAVSIVPDAKQWKRLGGSKALRHVVALPVKDRKPVIMQALGAGGDVRAVLRARGLAPPSDRPSYKSDAERLAEYVARLPDPPQYIRDIVEKYVQPKQQKGQRAARVRLVA